MKYFAEILGLLLVTSMGVFIYCVYQISIQLVTDTGLMSFIMVYALGFMTPIFIYAKLSRPTFCNTLPFNTALGRMCETVNATV